MKRLVYYRRQSLKICYLASSNSIHSYRWIKFFSSSGHDILWISLHKSEVPTIPGVRYHEFPLSLNAPLIFFSTLFRIRKLIKVFRPDVLHVHSAGIYGLCGFLSGYRPRILTAWGSDVLVGTKSPIKRPFIKYALQDAELTTCDAYHMRDAMVRLGVYPERVHIINFGIDTQQFSPDKFDHDIMRRLGIDGVPCIISLRNLKPIYNVDTLIEAAPAVLREFPRTCFLICGKGSEEEKLKALAERLGVSQHIRFVGQVQNADLPAVLASSDVYVSTSLSDAGIAASTAEAMACGLPVVVTNSGENDKWIENGENGFLVPVQDPETLASRIIQLLRDKDLRETFKAKGRQTIFERNDYFHEMQKMEALYTDVISRANKRVT